VAERNRSKPGTPVTSAAPVYPLADAIPSTARAMNLPPLARELSSAASSASVPFVARDVPPTASALALLCLSRALL
jgi:hypothetical protein